METCDHICDTKILLVSIWNLKIPNTWCAKNGTFRNGISCVAHHKKGFLASYGLTCKRWKSELQPIFHNREDNIIIENGLMKEIVATLLWAKCGGEAQHSQSWELGVLRDSRIFRARLEKAQNTSHWGVLDVIGKV
jgi:hypothetical protein